MQEVARERAADRGEGGGGAPPPPAGALNDTNVATPQALVLLVGLHKRPCRHEGAAAVADDTLWPIFLFFSVYSGRNFPAMAS